MFKLSGKNPIDRTILKWDYIRYSPSEISTINHPNSQIYINIPREDSVISLLYSYIELNSDVSHAATGNRYVDGDNLRLVNLGPIVKFSNYRIIKNSGKHIEEVNKAHIVSLMNKLLTSARRSDDLFIGFDRSRDKRKQELTNNKNIKGKKHVKNYGKNIFGFAEHQERGTSVIGYKLALTRNNDNAVLNKHSANNNAKFKIIALEWYVPHYTPSLEKNLKSNGTDHEEDSYTASLSRKICFHERSEYSKFLDF